MKASVQQADSNYCFQECKRQMFWDNHMKNRKRVLQETRERHGCGCLRDLERQQGQWQNTTKDNDQNKLSCWEYAQWQDRQEDGQKQENNIILNEGALENNIIKRLERINFVGSPQSSEGRSQKEDQDNKGYCDGDGMEVEGAAVEDRRGLQQSQQKGERKGAGPQGQNEREEEQIGEFEEMQGSDYQRHSGLKKQVSKGAGAMNCATNMDYNDCDEDNDFEDSKILVATPSKRQQVLLSSCLQLSPEWVMDIPLNLQGTKPEGMKGKQQQQQQKCLRFLVLTKIGRNSMDILNCSKQSNSVDDDGAGDDNYWILDCWMQESKGVCVISDVLKINGDNDEDLINENDERLQWIKSHQQSAKQLDAKECLNKVTFKVVPELQRFLQATNEAIRISVTAKFPQENMQVPKLLAIMNTKRNMQNKGGYYSRCDNSDEEYGEGSDRDKRNQCDDEDDDFKGLLENGKDAERDCWIEQE